MTEAHKTFFPELSIRICGPSFQADIPRPSLPLLTHADHIHQHTKAQINLLLVLSIQAAPVVSTRKNKELIHQCYAF